MSSETTQRAAEQAVVREAIKRGWLTVADVGDARARAEASGRPLLAELGARLDDGQRQALREVHEQVLAAVPAEPGAEAGWATAATWAGQASAAPRRLGPYELERELARGGMGSVHLARHVDLDRRVALKLLLVDAGQGAPERFVREAKALAALQHPGIVRLFDAGEEAGRRWMALELMAGGSLQDRLGREGPLEPRVAVALLEPVARAIGAAHAHGLLHRDLKPANVLLDETGRPKVTDFGIARWLDGRSQQLTRTGVAVGTPSYAPPEQVVGDAPVDVRADVYGLGATLYALLTGRPPFEGGSFMEIVTRLVMHEPQAPSVHRPGVPPELDLLVLRCLEKSPAERYPTAEALADELGRWLRGEPLQARPVTRGRRVGKLVRRRPIATAVAAACAGLAALCGWLWATRARAAAPSAPEVVWLAPEEGAATSESTTEVTVDVRGAAEWVEVQVELEGAARPSPRKLREAGRAQLVVALRPGDNAVTLRWRASSGEEGTLGPRRLRSSPVPAWFWTLPPGERPPLPLPDGVEFDPRIAGYVATVDRSELVWVPPGSFDQARPAGDLIDPTHTLNSQPADAVRRVTLTRGYFLGRYEVTWAKYDAFCAATGRPKVSRALDYEMAVQGSELGFHTTALPLPGVTVTPGDDHPAFRVSWSDAAAYCERARLRLPTEAEWEWAARGIDGRGGLPWGDGNPGPADTNVLSTSDDGFAFTAPVGQFARDLTWSGCHDLAGNVSEWVADRWSTLGPLPVVDPVGPDLGERRVVRGACWTQTPNAARLSYRGPRVDDARVTHEGLPVADPGGDPLRGDDRVGFRVAR